MTTQTIDANQHNSRMRRLANYRRKLRAAWVESMYATTGVVYDTLSAAHDAIATIRSTVPTMRHANFVCISCDDGIHVSLTSY